MTSGFQNSNSEGYSELISTIKPILKFVGALGALEPLGGHNGDK